jgi:predicted transcriptional regulator
MAKKRTRLQIIHDILKAVHDKNNRIRPTHILYKSNLSHQMMEEYLKELIEKEFIVENKGEGTSKTYSLTQKGFDYLNQYRLITEFTDSFGLEQE